MRMRLPGVIALVLLALIAAGCGGSSSNDAAEETTELTSTEETSTEETTTEETTESGSGSGSVDADDVAAVLGSEECQALFGLSGQFATALGAAGSGAGDELEKSTKLFDELAEKAPDEIRDDFAIVAEAWKEIVGVYADIGITPGETPDADAIAKLQEASEDLAKKLDNEEVNAASERISKWVEENCTPNG